MLPFRVLCRRPAASVSAPSKLLLARSVFRISHWLQHYNARALAAMKQHNLWKEKLRRQKNPNSPQVTGKKRKREGKTIFQGSNEEVLASEAEDLYTRHDLPPSTSPDPADGEAPEVFSEIELDVLELSSTGDGLALRDGHVYTVPFAVPGDKVLAKVL